MRESLPAVIEAWKYRIKHGSGFTIREAKWAARLSVIEQDTVKLLRYVSKYTGTELIFEISGRPFDSSFFDKDLIGLPTSKEEALEFLHIPTEQYEKIMDIAKKGGTR